jgi:hypothetical protein
MADAREVALNIVVVAAVMFLLFFVTSLGKIPSFLYCMGLANTVLVVYYVARNRIQNKNVDSAYGRYSGAKEGGGLWLWPVDAHVGWLVMEAPSMVVPALVLAWAVSQHRSGLGFWANYCPVLLFLLHYVLRTYVMARLTVGGKPMPFSIMIQGFCFCTVNGLSQSYYHLYEVKPAEHARPDGRQLFGLVLFFAGMFMNHHSDRTLRNLRKGPEDKGYYIPMGGAFRYWSSPNLIGEIAEWCGYAAFCGDAMAAGFALSTMAIIGNRAYGHHQWYMKRFGDKYPRNRWALVPGVV